MREDEAGRPRVPWRSHPWFKQISSALVSVGTTALLTTPVVTSLVARKNKNRKDDREGKDGASDEKNRDGNRDRDRDDKRANDRKDDREAERENADRRDRDDGGRNRDRESRREPEDDGSNGAKSHVRKEQNNDLDDEPDDDEDDEDTGGGRDGGGGGGGNNAGNAGIGFFDSPLATKARRRARDFDNADREDEEDGIFVDVDPEGESIYETDSISFATGPEGVEILTRNITYFAEPTPTPTPFPTLEMPVREPGFPFGENFPFGDWAVGVAPTPSAPSDPGDGAAPPASTAPVDTAPVVPPADSDGGDNTMDFAS